MNAHQSYRNFFAMKTFFGFLNLKSFHIYQMNFTRAVCLESIRLPKPQENDPQLKRKIRKIGSVLWAQVHVMESISLPTEICCLSPEMSLSTSETICNNFLHNFRFKLNLKLMHRLGSRKAQFATRCRTAT